MTKEQIEQEARKHSVHRFIYALTRKIAGGTQAPKIAQIIIATLGEIK